MSTKSLTNTWITILLAVSVLVGLSGEAGAAASKQTGGGNARLSATTDEAAAPAVVPLIVTYRLKPTRADEQRMGATATSRSEAPGTRSASSRSARRPTGTLS